MLVTLFVGCLVVLAIAYIRFGRRKKDGWWSVVAVLTWFMARDAAAPYFAAWRASLPVATRAAIQQRIDMTVFLFWLLAFGAVSWLGLAAAVQSFAIVGAAEKPTGALRKTIPFVDEYWTVVDRRESMSLRQRIGIAMHHLGFSVSLLVIAGAGLLLTYRFPAYPVWLFLAGGIVAALLLNPARSDRRRAARLAHPPLWTPAGMVE